MSDKTLLLVDGSSYLYRAYHALPDLRGPGGVPTGAIRGVVAMMKLLREQYPAAHGACVFDAKGKTFRDDWYAEYKATRTRDAVGPGAADRADPRGGQAARLAGAHGARHRGRRRDRHDLVHGRERRLSASSISTGDKDLAQLVDEHVTLINTMSNETPRRRRACRRSSACRRSASSTTWR